MGAIALGSAVAVRGMEDGKPMRLFGVCGYVGDVCGGVVALPQLVMPVLITVPHEK
jgi:hypothetical protein